MKKIFLLMLCVTLCTGFVSCSDDDDDPITQNNGSNGNYDDDEDDEDDKILCNACKGTGICKICHGSGESGNRNCGFCGHWNGTCPICAGEGYY